MALLYSKDEELEIDSNGDVVGRKKVQAKKRRLDPANGERVQSNKVVHFVLLVFCCRFYFFFHLKNCKLNVVFR